MGKWSELNMFEEANGKYQMKHKLTKKKITTKKEKKRKKIQTHFVNWKKTKNWNFGKRKRNSVTFKCKNALNTKTIYKAIVIN